MLFEKYEEKEISYDGDSSDDYENDHVENMKVHDEFYYDKENVLRCPDCNNIVFYVENKSTHVCPNKENNTVKIDESMIKDKGNKFVCKIGNL